MQGQPRQGFQPRRWMGNQSQHSPARVMSKKTLKPGCWLAVTMIPKLALHSHQRDVFVERNDAQQPR
jgi:hypothetical protein